MKLKKLMALALSGVLAVSMLAGCNGKTNGGNNGEGEGEGEGTPATGYSATLEKYMSDDVKEMDNVTFRDNAEQATALENAAKNISAAEVVKTAAENPVPNSIDGWTSADYVNMIAELKDAYDIQDNDLQVEDMDLLWAVNSQYMANRNLNDAVVYAVTGSVDLEEALEQVAGKLDTYFKQLPAQGEVDNGVQAGNPALLYDYDYVISVSVVNKPVTVFADYSGSVNYIAVTVSRTIA